MASKLRDLNTAMKKLKRRKADTESLVTETGNVLSALREANRHRINKSVNKKILKVWKSFFLLKERVTDLSIALLGEEIKNNQEKKKTGERKVRISDPSRLVYKEPPDNGPEEMK